MTTYLGVHDGHNAAAALIQNGRVIAAVQEERLTRYKNQGGVPRRSIDDVLAQAGLQIDDVAGIGLNGQHMSFEHLDRETLLHHYEHSSDLRERLKQPLKVTPIYGLYRRKKVRERKVLLTKAGFDAARFNAIDHHTCHAAAAYHGSGLKGRVLVLTCDGSGDNVSATVSIADGGRIERIAEVPANDSIGRLYSMVTFMLGMTPLEHEYKVMGLAPYVADAAKAASMAEQFHRLFEFDPKNSMRWRRRAGVPSMYSSYDFFRDLLYRQRFDFVSAGLQKFTEDMLVQWVNNCIRETGIRRLACSGGVFMNVKANKLILEQPLVEQLFVFPTCGDETNAIGAAYHLHAHDSLTRGEPVDIPPIGPIYWGREFSDAEIEDALRRFNWSSRIRADHVANIESDVASALARGEVVARAKGRMEFGARALGNRSILARADNMDAVRIINDMIKNRDFWMPFAPSVLAERADDYYSKPKPMAAPYMIMAFDSREETRHKFPGGQHPYDRTTRPQEVTAESNPDYYRLLKYYEDLTGEGVILNTSFNLHGFPVVYSPEDALSVLDRSGLRNLALGNWWISKC